MSFDYSQFSKYIENFTNVRSQFDTWLRRFLLKEALQFVEDAKMITPVDTGKLIGAYSIGPITKKGNTLSVEIINPTEYASHIEYGHAKPYKSGIAVEDGPDWVRGFFMFTITSDKIKQSLPVEFETEFDVWLKNMGL